MKKLLASVLSLALAILMQPLSVVAAAPKAPQRANIGQVSGRAMVDGKPLPNVSVRLRSIDTGQIMGTTTAKADGGFSFTGLSAGNFVVETVGANGVILGTSMATLAAGAMVAANLTVGTSAAALAAAGVTGGIAAGLTGGLTTATASATAGVGAVAGGAASGLGALLGSTVGLVTLGAATVGITAGLIATQTTVSGSQ